MSVDTESEVFDELVNSDDEGDNEVPLQITNNLLLNDTDEKLVTKMKRIMKIASPVREVRNFNLT